MSTEKMYLYSWIARVLERMTLSLIIVGITIILIIAFWKSLQKIDFDIKSEKNSFHANIVFATPIFVLLIFVVFTFISFSNPISIKAKQPKADDSVGSDIQSLSFYGSSDNDGVIDMITILHRSDQKISEFISGKKENELLLTESQGLLKTIKKDMIFRKYGSDLVNNCNTKTSTEYSEEEC